MIKKAVLAGGCFWGLEDLIRKQPGVINTIVGYTGGNVINPTYENHEGHAEAVEIEYDTDKTSYKKILDFFFQIHNTLHSLDLVPDLDLPEITDICSSSC
jgi:peptide-methionine (S)-S-oxide reductase